MKFKKLETKYGKYHFKIEEDYPEVGAYLYVFNKQGKCVRDDLQDNVKHCKEIAFEYYSVPEESWELTIK
jgi:hypothetical protein